jgi:hypothetical protein
MTDELERTIGDDTDASGPTRRDVLRGAIAVAASVGVASKFSSLRNHTPILQEKRT